jgi:hypothetical protein
MAGWTECSPPTVVAARRAAALTTVLEMADHLYHYTDARGLTGILTPIDLGSVWPGESSMGVCFRARHARDFVDDPEELRFGAPLLAKALRDFDGDFSDKGSLTQADFDDVARRLDAGQLTPASDDGVYVASFSKTDDDPHMWKYYASHGGGYCIELRRQPVIASGFTMVMPYDAARSGVNGARQFLIGDDVAYGDACRLKARRMLSQFPSDDNDPRWDSDHAVSVWRLHTHATRILVHLKNEKYLDENEFRLTSMIRGTTDIVEVGGSRFAKFYISNIDEALVSVTAGPNAGLDVARDALAPFPKATLKRKS